MFDLLCPLLTVVELSVSVLIEEVVATELSVLGLLVLRGLLVLIAVEIALDQYVSCSESIGDLSNSFTRHTERDEQDWRCSFSSCNNDAGSKETIFFIT